VSDESARRSRSQVASAHSRARVNVLPGDRLQLRRLSEPTKQFLDPIAVQWDD
jgi:hypothetical protein